MRLSPVRMLRWACGAVLFSLGAVASAAVAPTEKAMVDWVMGRETEMIALLEKSVRLDSRSENHAGVKQVGDLFAAELKAAGLEPTWIVQPPEIDRGGHLFAEHKGRKGKRLLLIGHLDTVLPASGFTREGDTGRGSGVSDMKGGNIVIVYALKALQAAGALDDTQIIVALTGDEEMPGVPVDVSRRDFLAAAKRSDIALAFESGIKGQGTVARRGSSTWNLEVTSVTGHSSGVFSAAMGSGAIYEAARILEGFHTELRQYPGLTANAALIAGGTDLKEEGLRISAEGKTNIIPPRVLARGDIRAASPEQLEKAVATMQAVVAKNRPRTETKLTMTYRYPPMPPLPKNLEVLAHLDAVSRDLGHGPVIATDVAARGAGDSAFASPHAAVLDGLGPYGGGGHTANETIDLKSLAPQAAQAAVLIYRLTR